MDGRTDGRKEGKNPERVERKREKEVYLHFHSSQRSLLIILYIGPFVQWLQTAAAAAAAVVQLHQHSARCPEGETAVHELSSFFYCCYRCGNILLDGVRRKAFAR